MNGYTTAVEGLPKIHLPGEQKFISYKNSLQGYCQKMKFPVPQYQAEKEISGLRGTVTFSSSFVRAEEISGSAKEADSRVAYDALQQLGYLKGHKFVFSNELKRRKNEMGQHNSKTKEGKPVNITSKSELNQYAQQKKLPSPTYVTVIMGNGFSSTVTIDNRQFKSLGTHTKGKSAEQNAAQVALNTLVGSPLPMDTLASPPTGVPPVPLKTRLQEYCQKESTPLPVYESQFLLYDKTYQSKVIVHGVEYCGRIVKGKKKAEAEAAEVALRALGLLS